MDATELLGYVGALVVGLVLGLVGGGGSILTVPLLVYLLGFNPIVATGYSLFVVGTSSLVGVIQKHLKKLVDFKTGLAFSFPSFLAVYLTRRYLVPSLPKNIFSFADYIITKDMLIMFFFSIVMLVASISMIKKTKKNKPNSTPPYYKIFLQGLIIGVITGIIGAGGGFLYVPALVLWTNLSMKKAVGTSLVIISINSLIGFTGDVQTLEIDWSFLLPFSFLTILGIIIGGRLSKFISNQNLKKGFGYFTFIVALFIIYEELKLII